MNKTSRRNINKKCSTNTSSSTSTSASASASAGVNCGQGNGENRDQAELNVDLKLEKNLELELVNGFSNDSSISGTKFKKKGLENGKHMLLMGPRVQAADGLARNDVNNFTNTTTTSAGAGTGTAGASATLTTFTGNRNSERGCSSSSRAEEKSSEVEEFHNFGESSGETKSKSKSKCSGHGHSEPQRRHNKFDSSENIPKTLEGDHLIGVILDDASSQTERTRTETEELIVDSRHTPTSCTLDPETNGCCSNKDDEDEGDHLIRNLEDLSIEIETTPARTEEKEEKPDSDSPPQPQVEYVQYENELQMPMIMRIIQKDLSEPYSIYTYRYFIHNWPKLCFLAMCEGNCVGAIVCKLDFYRKVIRRGYIAMLAVDKNYRKRGLGSTLVRRAIQEMIRGEADEVVLETEITNRPALQLYEGLGFVRDKRLFRYYLNGVDALRLKLWLR